MTQIEPGPISPIIRRARSDEYDEIARVWMESWVSTGLEEASNFLLAQLRADARDAPRVVDELLARPALLAGMGLGGEPERAGQQLPVDVRVVRGDLGEQLVDEMLMRFLSLDDRHTSQCTPGPGDQTPP